VKQSVAPAAPPQGARLPRLIVPSRYVAQLTIGSGEQLGGHIEISGELPAPSRVIWLHGVELAVTAAVAKRGDAHVPLTARAQAWNDTELIELQAAEPLAAGAWTIAIDYTAGIERQGLLPEHLDMHDADAVAAAQAVLRADNAHGAFRETDANGSYVFTQFEAMDARRVFPCIDEPDVKVPWQLSLVVPAADVAASNTPAVRETPMPGDRKRVEFAPTRPLPSYVIAFAVGPFEVVDAGSSAGGVPVRLLLPPGTPGREHAVGDGRQAGQVLDALAAWTQQPYAYGKLDLVAVPRTGNEWAAMENPGLVTFAARFLDPRLATLSWIGVVAHELAHQWFGDLVTPKWWSDVWLSEAFAEWIGGKAVAQVSPATADPSGFANYVEDELLPRGPVRGPVTTAKDVEAYMGGWHGAQVLRMIEAYVGAETFQRAVRAYLAAHAGGNATTADLVAAFDAATGAKWTAAFADAIDAPKPPELAVRLACVAGHASVHVTGRGTVPVCVAYDRDGQRARACGMLAGGARDVALDTRACPTWFLPNADGAGTYQVTWDGMLAAVQHGWSAMTRADRVELAREASTAEAVPLVPALDAIGDADARALIVAILDRDARLVPDDLRAALATWIQTKFGAAARDVRFRARSHDERGTSADRALVSLVAQTGDPALVAAGIALASSGGLSDEYRELVLVLAESANPSVATRILAEVAANPSEGDDGIALLRRMPDIIAVATADPDQLGALRDDLRQRLLASACSMKERAAVASAASADTLATIDACIAKRAALDPVFRAWLAPAKP
jgi:alanyl aminopeptidase